MKTAYIFHDAFSSPLSDWYPWMKTTLEGMGYLVYVPNLPTPGAQSYESWKVVVKNYIPTWNEETILVGHGSGGLFALRLVEESTKQIQGLFLVATYAEAIGNVGYDRLNKTFFDHAFDWSKIKSNAMTIRIFAGDNDPFVPGTATQNLSNNLGQDVETIPDGGHLNKAAGFVQAVAVAQGIKESLNALDKSIQVEKEEEGTIPATGSAPDEHPLTPSEREQTEQTTQVPEAPKLGHTMFEDMSHLVNSNRGKVASSLLTKARTDQATKEAVSPGSPKNILYTIGIVISLIVLISIGGYLAQKYAPAATIPKAPPVPSLIQSEDHTKIDVIPNQPFFLLEQKIRAAVANPETEGRIDDIYYASGANRASFAQTLDALGISDLPAALPEEFSPASGTVPVFMHGLAQVNGQAAHFLVVRVQNYDTSFSLMRAWEGTMLRDLGSFMGIPQDFLKTKLTKDSFHDELIANKNVRVLRYKKPADITLDDPANSSTTVQPVQTDGVTSRPTSATGNDTASATGSTGFVIDGIKNISIQNPFVITVSPYQENDIMLAYFFLNEHTIIITDKVELIPELLKRWSNSQIYQ